MRSRPRRADGGRCGVRALFQVEAGAGDGEGEDNARAFRGEAGVFVDDLEDGVFDIGSIVFYLTVIIFFLFLTVQSLEKRRWSA